MSHWKNETLKCPCGEEFESAVWSAVNAQQEPRLRDAILDGQLNVAKCPACRKMLYAEQFLIYHDPDTELMVFVYPQNHKNDPRRWTERTRVDFETAQRAMEKGRRLPYSPLTVFGLDALVELLRDEQERRNQEDVFEAMSPSLPLEVIRLRRSAARTHGTPARLPLSSRNSGELDQRLREGLRLLLAANDRFSVYKHLADELERNGKDVSFLAGDDRLPGKG